MNRRFMITGLLGSLLILGACAPAAEEQESAVQDQAAAPPAAAPPAAAPPAEPEPAKLPPERLDQLVGPIALYPDPLLIQVLIASTYPLEIVEADRWRSQNKDLKDDALTKALEEKDWDPSVEGLTQFPDLLKRMSDNLDWTKDIGDAFLGQQKDVLDAVQRMRKLAQQAGSLQTTKEQTVTKEVVNDKETIIIEPAQPETVYVPQYPPQAYGTAAPPPAYPTSYGYPPAYPYGYTGTDMMMASMLSFGVGIGVGALIDGGCDWDDHEVYCGNCGGGGGGKNQNVNVNVDRDKTVNRGDRTVNRGDREGRGDGQRWQHNPEHRRNVGYRDPGTAKRFEGQTQREAREQARGYDGGARGERPATPSQRPATPSQRPARVADRRGDGGQARADRGGRPATADRGGGAARPTSRPTPASAGGRSGAFGGYGDAGATRAASQRGASSRGGQSWAGSGGGGRGGGYGGGGGRAGGGGRGGGGERGGGGGRRR